MDDLVLPKNNINKYSVNKKLLIKIKQRLTNFCLSSDGQNNSPEQCSVQPFIDWVKGNNEFIANYLIDAGIDFTNEPVENIKHPVLQLLLDNCRHYPDKLVKKQSYRATLEHNVCKKVR